MRCKIYHFSYTNKSSNVNCTCAIDEYVLGRSPNVVIKVVGYRHKDKSFF